MTKKETSDKPKKRGNNDGSFQERNGRWTLTITVGRDPLTGKVKRKSFTGKSKQEAREKKNNYIAAQKNGTYIEPSCITTGQWLIFWFNEYKKKSLSPTTIDRYESIINTHLIPSLGSIKLQELETDHIQVLYNNKSINGKKDGKGLAATSVKYIHTILRASLEKALRLGHINKNPAIECTLPKVTQCEVDVISEEDIIKLRSNLDFNNTLDMAILLNLLTGLRKGELTALTWSDIDFENNSITINKTAVRIIDRDNKDNSDNNINKYKYIIKEPKTASSKRNIPLSASIVPLLKKHHKRIIEENLKSGRNQTEYNLVFPTKNGTLISSPNLSRHWKKILKKSNIDYIKFHALRHTFASLLNGKNENPKVIQLLLGHSKLSTTMNIYVHSNDEQKKNAIAKIDYLIDYKENETNGKEDENIIKEQKVTYLIS